MKYYAFTSSPETFLLGWSSSFILIEKKENAAVDWVFIAETEIDIESVDMNKIRAGAVQCINNEIEQRTADFTAGMEELKKRKKELLSITHQPENEK